MGFKLLIINALTLIRIIGTIILVPVYQNYGGVAVGILAFVCYLTDSIDGILARYFKASTFFGAVLDGFADKLFTIMNFVVLYLVTPYALIPIIFEVLIMLIQFIKFMKKLNVQSNIVGKFKVWVLALCVVVTFFASDISNISFLTVSMKEYILNIPSSNLYLILLLPAIIMEILTFISYGLEIIIPKKINNMNNINPKELKMPVLKSDNVFVNFKNIWLNPQFYKEHKNDTNLRDLRKLSK